MRKQAFNDGWVFWKLGDEGNKKKVSLPHDAMLFEKRSQQSAGGVHISWFEGGDYIYEKVFEHNDLTKETVLEFEGVYHNAEVLLNEQFITSRPYGYTNFYANLSSHLKRGKNRLRVMVHNSQQPNSRWYTGSGIYRPVSLYSLPQKHIMLNGIKIKTVDYVNPTISVSVKTSCAGDISIDILEEGNEVVLYHTQTQTDGTLRRT